MRTTRLSRIRFFVLLLLLFLIVISFHPVIVNIGRGAGLSHGSILSRYIILVYGVLFVFCLNVKSMLKPRLIRVCWGIYFVIGLYFIITLGFFGSTTMMEDVRSIAICLVAIMIGWQLDLNDKQYKTLLLFFSLTAVFVGLMQVFMNVGGFVINDLNYADSKNSLGVILATSSVIFLFMGINRKQAGLVKWSYIGLFVLTIVILLTIRSRADTLAVIIVLLYVLYERYKKNHFVFYFIIVAMLLFLLFVFMPASIKDYVYNSFTQNSHGDITSGRLERNETALRYLSYHIWFGNLTENIHIAQVHNYVLNRAFELGVVFVFPIILLYLYLLLKVVSKTIKSDNHNMFTIGYYILLIPFIVSLAEPTFPFGPGTATVFNYILFGMSLKHSYYTPKSNYSDETLPHL